MFPVFLKPGIGTASALNLTVGAAEAAAVIAISARPTTARQVDALRISYLSSFDGQLRLDPGNSGAMPVRRHRDPRHSRRGTVAICWGTLSAQGDAYKF